MTKFSKIVILMEVKVGISMRDDDNFVESMINPFFPFLFFLLRVVDRVMFQHFEVCYPQKVLQLALN